MDVAKVILGLLGLALGVYLVLTIGKALIKKFGGGSSRGTPGGGGGGSQVK